MGAILSFQWRPWHHLHRKVLPSGMWKWSILAYLCSNVHQFLIYSTFVHVYLAFVVLFQKSHSLCNDSGHMWSHIPHKWFPFLLSAVYLLLLLFALFHNFCTACLVAGPVAVVLSFYLNCILCVIVFKSIYVLIQLSVLCASVNVFEICLWVFWVEFSQCVFLAVCLVMYANVRTPPMLVIVCNISTFLLYFWQMHIYNLFSNMYILKMVLSCLVYV